MWKLRCAKLRRSARESVRSSNLLLTDQTRFSAGKQTLSCCRNVKDLYGKKIFTAKKIVTAKRWLRQTLFAVSTLPNALANSAEDYCSVAAVVAVVANQAVAVLVAAGAVSSTAVHSGLAAGRIVAMQPPVLRHYY